MSDIDWFAVQLVCEGTALVLKPDEKRMALRRLSERMLRLDDWHWARVTATKLTTHQVAQRLLRLDSTTGKTVPIADRSVERILAELPAATKSVCLSCREPMWVLSDGLIEAHGTPIYELCPMSGRAAVRGLAATRPDLYQWLEVTA